MINSVDVLQLIVEKDMADNRSTFFVQIGANDGLACDQWRPYVLRYGLPGLLVEPQPDVFEQLKNNYAGRPELMFECACIGAEDGTTRMYRHAKVPGYQPYCSVLCSQHRDALTDNPEPLTKILEEIDVISMTVKTLFARHAITAVDYLIVDTEGSDAMVVGQALEILEPRVVFHENWRNLHLKDALLPCLVERGYAFAESHVTKSASHDVIACKQDQWANRATLPLDRGVSP